VTLKGFLLLGGFLALDGLTSTFQEKLFKDRPLFATASTSSNKHRWGVFIVSYWILPMLFL